MKIIRSACSWLLIKDGPSATCSLETLAFRHGYRVLELCDDIGCCSRHLHTLFVRDIGLAPKEWLKQQRMVMARRWLGEGKPPEVVAEELGFSNYDSFRREFRGCYGVPPLRYRELRYGSTQSQPVLQPATEPCSASRSIS